MWFAKFFGGRSGHGDDELPTAMPAPQAQASIHASRLSAPPVRRRSIDTQRKGFDPYNSGAFQRRNAWERVNRR